MVVSPAASNDIAVALAVDDTAECPVVELRKIETQQVIGIEMNVERHLVELLVMDCSRDNSDVAVAVVNGVVGKLNLVWNHVYERLTHGVGRIRLLYGYIAVAIDIALKIDMREVAKDAAPAVAGGFHIFITAPAKPSRNCSLVP